MKSLADQITALQLEIASLKRAAGRLKKLERQLQLETSQLTKLEKKVEKEYKDILELKKKSWIDLFLDQQAEKEKRLEKENKEYYDAMVQLKDTERSIKLIEFEIDILREKAAKLNDKELLLQKLKHKQKHTIELSVKRASDKEIVQKNRRQNTFHKLIRSGRKIQMHLEDIQSSLNKIETWLNYDLNPREKKKIFVEEFVNIDKILFKQNLELIHYNAELERLPEFEDFIDTKSRKDFEKTAAQCFSLREQLTLLAKNTLNSVSSYQHLQNELTKLKAKIIEIQSNIDQTTRLLRTS